MIFASIAVPTTSFAATFEPVFWSGQEVAVEGDVMQVVRADNMVLGEDGTVAARVWLVPKSTENGYASFTEATACYRSGVATLLAVTGHDLGDEGKAGRLGNSLFVDADGTVVFEARTPSTGSASGWYSFDGAATKRVVPPGLSAESAEGWSIAGRDSGGRTVWRGPGGEVVIANGGSSFEAFVPGEPAPGFRGDIEFGDLISLELGPGDLAVARASVGGTGIHRYTTAMWLLEGSSVTLIAGPGVLAPGDPCPGFGEERSGRISGELEDPMVLADGTVWVLARTPGRRGVFLRWAGGSWSPVDFTVYALIDGAWSLQASADIARVIRKGQLPDTWTCGVGFGVESSLVPLNDGLVVARMTEWGQSGACRLSPPVERGTWVLSSSGVALQRVDVPDMATWAMHASGAGFVLEGKPRVNQITFWNPQGARTTTYLPDEIQLPDGAKRRVSFHQIAVRSSAPSSGASKRRDRVWPDGGLMIDSSGATVQGFDLAPEPGLYDQGAVICVVRP